MDNYIGFKTEGGDNIVLRRSHFGPFTRSSAKGDVMLFTTANMMFEISEEEYQRLCKELDIEYIEWGHPDGLFDVTKNDEIKIVETEGKNTKRDDEPTDENTA